MNLTLPVSGAWRTTAIDLGQWLPGGSADGRNRRVSRVALRLGEGLLAEPTADTQPGLWGLVFMPHTRPSIRWSEAAPAALCGRATCSETFISYGTPSCVARAMTLSATASANLRPASMSLR